jgi:hemoglobin-like flavoprotein
MSHLTAHDIAILDRALVRLQNHMGIFVKRFYAHLFELEPNTRALFSENMEAQHQKLSDFLFFLFGSLHYFERVTTHVRELGRRHQLRGIQAKDYDTFTRALLLAMRDVLRNDYTSELETTCVNLCNVLAEHMLGGYITDQPQEPA